jgi:hypothetical protein
MRDSLRFFGLALVATLALSPSPAFSQAQTTQGRIPQQIVINGQNASGAYVTTAIHHGRWQFPRLGMLRTNNRCMAAERCAAGPGTNRPGSSSRPGSCGATFAGCCSTTARRGLSAGASHRDLPTAAGSGVSGTSHGDLFPTGSRLFPAGCHLFAARSHNCDLRPRSPPCGCGACVSIIRGSGESSDRSGRKDRFGSYL